MSISKEEKTYIQGQILKLNKILEQLKIELLPEKIEQYDVMSGIYTQKIKDLEHRLRKESK